MVAGLAGARRPSDHECWADGRSAQAATDVGTSKVSVSLIGQRQRYWYSTFRTLVLFSRSKGVWDHNALDGRYLEYRRSWKPELSGAHVYSVPCH
jgi:hypothetical protein